MKFHSIFWKAGGWILLFAREVYVLVLHFHITKYKVSCNILKKTIIKMENRFIKVSGISTKIQ